MFSAILLLVTKALAAGLLVQRDPLIIETVYGKIHGQILKTIQEPHLKYYAFKGIPYAKSPLKKLRFQPPLKPEVWNDIKQCKDYGSPCLQISANGSILGDEDCLTLNIFTKNLDASQLKPVMFWIHGGAHIRGSSAEFGPDYLVEKPIVLVTINYRLNIFGFFAVNDENAYGNVAIKDQIAALEWLQKNIVKFGGDPSRVTIFGESSGANSVSLLQLSARTKGLFHQIIAESGSALNSKYLQRHPLKYAFNTARYFNINFNTTKDIVEGLQGLESKKLIQAVKAITNDRIIWETSAFGPVIEPENSNAVITRSPFELLKDGSFIKVPFIFGYNTNEGTVNTKLHNSKINGEDMDTRYKLFAPESLNLDSIEDQELVGKIVRDYFLGNSSANETEKVLKYLGQELLVRGIRKELDFLRKHSDGYFYRFSYKGTHTITYQGVGHGEELQYLFAKDGTTDSLTENDLLTRKRMVQMWSNFAIFGCPILEDILMSQKACWKNTNSNSVNFMDIGENLLSGKDPDEEKYEFWENLFQTYGKEPFQTY